MQRKWCRGGEEVKRCSYTGAEEDVQVCRCTAGAEEVQVCRGSVLVQRCKCSETMQILLRC